MAAFKVKLVIDRGATFRHHFTWMQKVNTVVTPIDLTGYKARMQIRSEYESPVVLASLTTENGGITLGGTTGTIDLFISNADTTTFAWDSGVYDIEFVAPSTDVIRKIYGTVFVTPEVTRG